MSANAFADTRAFNAVKNESCDLRVLVFFNKAEKHCSKVPRASSATWARVVTTMLYASVTFQFSRRFGIPRHPYDQDDRD